MSITQDIDNHTGNFVSNEHSIIVSTISACDDMASSIIKSTPSPDKIFNCSLKPGIIALVPNLYKLPKVETLPAIAISLFEFLTASCAI